MIIKLKRCPFCNANAKYSYKEWRKKENLFLFNTELYCEKCGATPISAAKEVSYKYDSNTGAIIITEEGQVTLDDFAERWNDRKEEK